MRLKLGQKSRQIDEGGCRETMSATHIFGPDAEVVLHKAFHVSASYAWTDGWVLERTMTGLHPCRPLIRSVLYEA